MQRVTGATIQDTSHRMSKRNGTNASEVRLDTVSE